MYLNSFYIQKSKLLLFPLLKISKEEFKPENTYLAYKDIVKLKTPSLICAYKRIHDDNYYTFRNKTLFKHANFIMHFKDIDNDYMVFNLKEFSVDYKVFIDGKYSKFRKKTKTIIKESYNSTSIGPILIDTHLNPENYHKLYADYFLVDINALKHAHETLDPPNLKKEVI
jgi:hypothetical protein